MLSPWTSYRINLTHGEDLKDPDKILLPSRNLVLIGLREDESENRVPFGLLDNLPLDLGDGSVIKVSKSLEVCVLGPAHPVKSPIASRTDGLSPSNCLPFNLR